MKPEELITRNFEKEFVFSASRSSGPGGQNVNKVNSRIELRFNVFTSLLLSPAEKLLLSESIVNKLTDNGEIIIISQSERSQFENKRKAVEKFYRLIAKALTVKKKRFPTHPGAGAIARRLSTKRKRSDIKKLRGSSEDFNRE